MKRKPLPERLPSTLAFRDYLKAPVVKKIDVSNYKGTVGSVIVVNAKDDFRVALVKVSIHSSTGSSGGRRKCNTGSGQTEALELYSDAK